MTENELYPDAQAYAQWQYKDTVCYLMTHPRFRHICGYARFEKRPLIESGYHGIAEYVPVHGGITYANQDEAGYVYGFDCAHLDDDSNPDCHDDVWLHQQCELMVDAIKAAAKIEQAYLDDDSNESRAAILDTYHNELLGGPMDIKDNFMVMLNVLGGQL